MLTEYFQHCHKAFKWIVFSFLLSADRQKFELLPSSVSEWNERNSINLELSGWKWSPLQRRNNALSECEIRFFLPSRKGIKIEDLVQFSFFFLYITTFKDCLWLIQASNVLQDVWKFIYMRWRRRKLLSLWHPKKVNLSCCRMINGTRPQYVRIFRFFTWIPKLTEVFWMTHREDFFLIDAVKICTSFMISISSHINRVVCTNRKRKLALLRLPEVYLPCAILVSWT